MEQAKADEGTNVENETQTVEQTGKQSESNPVFSRVFIPNPNFGGTADSSKQFSIVSYNVLADCHFFRNDYSFTHPDHLEPDYRLNKLIEEIQFLDADIVCLQEVDPAFFQDQLLPHLKGYVIMTRIVRKTEFGVADPIRRKLSCINRRHGMKFRIDFELRKKCNCTIYVAKKSADLRFYFRRIYTLRVFI